MRSQGDAEALRSACLVEGIELQEPIGSGRSATVWRARWRSREVAVKVLAPDWRQAARERELDHPAILPILAEGRALGRQYLVLERFPTDLHRLLDGRPLAARLRRPVLLPLLDALEHAHERNVVHGDLKPANVLVDPAAAPVRVALTDFGQGAVVDDALLTSLKSAEREELEDGVSTLPYLAPERLAGAAASPAADLYALGVLLFEVLTGRLPHGLELPSELEAGLDPRFDALVKALLSRRPRERPDPAACRRELLRLLPRRARADLASEEPAVDEDMVRIPPGHLVIGDRGDPDASPMHEVFVPGFWLDRLPVRHQDYLEFVRATGAARPRTWPRSGPPPRRLLELPVTGVRWPEAQAYAAWLGKRLPTEQEWERAAQGPEHRRYPYGDEFDPSKSPGERLVPVGRHPQGASSEGVQDLTGNGWEWTRSVFAPYGKPGSGSGKRTSRTIRGGYDPRRPKSGSATFRAGLREDVADPTVGFRCALDDPGGGVGQQP